jgi:hypothetical protein
VRHNWFLDVDGTNVEGNAVPSDFVPVDGTNVEGNAVPSDFVPRWSR